MSNYSRARYVDAPEGDAPRGSEGLTGCATYNERTRDRMVAEDAMNPEPPRPKTAEQLAGEAGLAMHERWAREKRESEQAKTQARQKREADEKAAREQRTRQAQIQFQENAVLREASDLTSEEAQIFWTRLASMDKMLDAGVAAIVAEDIRSSRKV
jgi:hypothetical protein